MELSYSPAWFRAFGRPGEAATEREVAFLQGVLPLPPATVLDVACGFGRHARALAARGYAVTASNAIRRLRQRRVAISRCTSSTCGGSTSSRRRATP